MIRISLTTGKPEAKFEDFLIKFKKAEAQVTGQTQKPISEMSFEEYQEARKKAAEEAKAGWFAALGMDKDGKPPKKSRHKDPMPALKGFKKASEVSSAPKKTQSTNTEKKSQGRSRVSRRATTENH